ncbi:MAG: 2-oxoacid:acceptor oxidoreductase subunit alpha [Deltaproteobacteria bacterium]|nr:2-oxoacid:acceptor oxidoreductase subunit alpha [Deltaproteobacteria bacterium]
MQRPLTTIDDVVIRFVGDSGDGMQLTGTQFTNTTALAGNDLATFPDFPAEIRAPAGTRAGVSGFQVHFSSKDIHTPGDAPQVLIAMNPAALVANIKDLRKGGLLIVNTEKFVEREWQKADLQANPLEDGTVDDFQVVPVQIAKLTKEAVKDLGLSLKDTDRCKNFFALGMAYWLFSRDTAPTKTWIKAKFKAPFDEANIRALEAGWSYAETVELFHERFDVPAAHLPAGTYRNITGNEALALGLLTASHQTGLRLFLGAYPITPASDVLHYLAKFKDFGVITFQAEDEIAAVSATIGAAFGGALGVTTSSGPGIALKGEALGLAVMTELPIVVVDVQRGGPSTGLPTKTEQSDLMIAMYGRHGEAPMPVLAACTPADCFVAATEAARIATSFMIPVMLLTDGYIANGSEPWRVPDLSELSATPVVHRTEPEGFAPYKRDPVTLARPWAVPGTPGLEHRIGGLEKQDGTGNVSYDPANHEHMVRLRADKVRRIEDAIPPLEVFGDADGLLVVSWGGTYGSVRTAVEEARAQGLRVGHLHLRWLNPFPKNLDELLLGAERVLVCELNLGQLVQILRARFLVDALSYAQVQGKPFKVSALLARIQTLSA